MKVKFKFDEVLKAIGRASICDKYIELDAEPVSSDPEWVEKLHSICANSDLIGLEDFIQTEIIKKICEEIKREFYQDLPPRGEFADDIDTVKSKWLKGE